EAARSGSNDFAPWDSTSSAQMRASLYRGLVSVSGLGQTAGAGGRVRSAGQRVGPVMDRIRRSTLVQPEFVPDRLDFGWLDEARMRHCHRIEQAVELARPEVEEFLELGKMRVQVVLLPDVVLQDVRMIGHAVEDVRGGEAVAFELAAEVGAGHPVSPDSLS